MPFRAPFDDIYHQLIKPTIQAMGISILRADEIYNTASVIDDLFDKLEESDFIIADLTDRNPNVAYELGLAHALEKPVIIIAQELTDIPFDLRHLRIIIYDMFKDYNWRENLSTRLIETIRYISTNPRKSLAWEKRMDSPSSNSQYLDILRNLYNDYKADVRSHAVFKLEPDGITQIEYNKTISCRSKIYHIYMYLFLDQPGVITVEEIIDSFNLKELKWKTFKRRELEYSFVIFLDRPLNEGETFKYQVKLRCSNYFQKLFEDKSCNIQLRPAINSNMIFQEWVEEYKFPNTDTFSNVEVKFIKHHNKDLLKKPLETRRGAKFRTVRADFGDMKSIKSEIDLLITI